MSMAQCTELEVGDVYGSVPRVGPSQSMGRAGQWRRSTLGVIPVPGRVQQAIERHGDTLTQQSHSTVRPPHLVCTRVLCEA